ncbi:MAG TPA: DoxX family protein [Pseudolysinimonas sp.]|nr:DoxX family protein [Pseudolysinimonas sp.]
MSTTITQKSPSRLRTVVSWIFQVLGGLMFISIGIGRVSGTGDSVDTFEQVGVGQWFRFLVGSLEILGGMGLLIPLFAGLAAVCLTALMVGAMAIDLFVIDGGSILAPVMFAAVAVVVAVLRHRSITAPFAYARRRLSRAK